MEGKSNARRTEDGLAAVVVPQCDVTLALTESGSLHLTCPFVVRTTHHFWALALALAQAQAQALALSLSISLSLSPTAQHSTAQQVR
jgi:hypothetical protein